MSNYTHQTAPTQFVEAAGIRFAYRRFANRRNGPKIDIPLLFFMLMRCRPDWDITRPELKSAWEQGQHDHFYPYNKKVAQVFRDGKGF
jgi:hypothetical protein